MDIPVFKTQKELFDFLVANKNVIMTAKKSAIKYADGISYIPSSVNKSTAGVSFKASEDLNENEIEVLAVINTTNILDSHGDVHINGLWKKTLKENKDILHLQEHQMKFSNIIAESEDVTALTKSFKWSELGYKYEGETEALVFWPSIVKEATNPFMFNKYKNGSVKQHSVGMRYINLLMAINNKDYKEEFANWNKYIDRVVNKEDAEARGYFYPVLEAKIIEGSAVVRGSNPATPTINIMAPSKDTLDNEPSDDTQRRKLLLKQIFN